jgi:phage-related protein
MRKPGEHTDLDFRGNSLEVLSSFPLPIKETFGFNLRRLQNGERPACQFRPMPSVGPGIFELKDQDESTWYRVIYLTRVMGVIYVLHCFEKDSNKTSRRDLEIAGKRLQEVNAEIVQQRARLKKGEHRGSH